MCPGRGVGGGRGWCRRGLLGHRRSRSDVLLQAQRFEQAAQLVLLPLLLLRPPLQANAIVILTQHRSYPGQCVALQYINYCIHGR